MKPLPLTCSKAFLSIITLVAVSLLLTPQHARAQGATGATYAGGLIANPAQGVATSPDQAAFGVGADASAGTNSTAIGGVAIASGVNSTTVGNFSFAKGLNSSTLGANAGTNTATAGVTSVGAFSNFNTAGIYSTAVGAGNAFNTSAPNSLGAYSIAVGGSDGVGGVGAVASGASSIAIGLSSVASGLSSTAIGGTGAATRPTIAGAGFSTALGTGTQIANGATGATAVGDFNTVSAGALFSTTVGNFNTTGGANAVAIGSGNTANGASAIAIGNGSSANFTNSAAFGVGATATRANQQVFGTATSNYTMPGITSASSLANQTGATQFVTSDAGGNLATAGFGPSSIIALSNRVDLLGNRINNVRNEERGGVALAMAAGQIRYDDQPGKVSIGGGVGAFEDQGGAALGIGFTSPGGRVRGNISGGGSFHGEWGGGAGLSITLN